MKLLFLTLLIRLANRYLRKLVLQIRSRLGTTILPVHLFHFDINLRYHINNLNLNIFADTSQPITIPHDHMDRPAIIRTQSLNISASEKMIACEDDKVSLFFIIHSLLIVQF